MPDTSASGTTGPGDNEYDDGLIACTPDKLVIRRYSALLRPKRIPYERIRGVQRRSMGGRSGKWRIWGSGDLRHWLNLDPRRPQKEVALDVDLGRTMMPVITPDDPDRVVAVLRSHGVSVTEAPDG